MPGVPPDAVDNVKKLFKGLFKRGKNKKPDTSAPATQTSQQQSATPSQAPATQPPVAQQQSSSAAAADTNKPLPSTHPLATGTHSTPQEAVPINHAAQAGPGDGANDATTKLEAQGISPASATPATGSAPVSAVEKEATPPAVPAKDAGNTDSSTAAPVTDGAKENAPPTTTAAGNPLTAPKTDYNTLVAPKIDPAAANAPANDPAQAATNAIISSVAPNSTTAQLAGQVPKEASTTTAATDVKPTETAAGNPLTDKLTGDSKEAAAGQPSNAPVYKAAPGMSATSGPLADYPEGSASEETPAAAAAAAK